LILGHFASTLGHMNVELPIAMDDENNDSYTEYTESSHENWLQQFMSSLVGVVIGICLFIGSFVLLFHNEGRIDFSQAAKSAIVIPADTTASSPAQGKIVSLTGDITTPTTIGDGLYIKPGAYVALSRTVEMYAWEEKESKQESKQLGGSKTTTTTYRYNKTWTNRPAESIKFKHSTSHRNPTKALKDQVFKAPTATIGRYGVDMAKLEHPVSEIYCGDGNVITPGISRDKKQQLALEPALLLARKNAPTPQLVGQNYLFQGMGTPTTPRIGDLRICYAALPSQTRVTLFGRLSSSLITAAKINEEAFFRIFPGERLAAIGTLKTEYQLMLWGLRAGGFVMMWLGLNLILGPIAAIANVIPFLGDVVEALSGTASLLVAFLLSSVTIIVSSLLHNPVMLAIAATISLGVFAIGRLGIRSARA
jgi:Transmembrane protein 43